MELQQVISKLKKLKIDRAHGLAPHKPILILSVLQSIDNDLIDTNRIYITPELVALFKTNWSDLVISNHDCKFALPFYHLTGDGFWKLKAKTGFENIVAIKSSMRSFNQLNAAIAYAFIEESIFQILLNKQNRDSLIQIILDTYFPDTRTNFSNSGNNYLDNLESKVVNEDAAEYISEIKVLKTIMSQENFEEEIFLRGGAFKKEIPKIYNHTCCISGLRIDATINISMIDACHVIPFSESYNDTITNGLALCPNLHRAFDRGIISIDRNYKVIVSKVFKENKTHYSIGQFENKTIVLPQNQHHFPHPSNLEWHYLNVFKK